jgi:glycosyltransferase 2 family protein
LNSSKNKFWKNASRWLPGVLISVVALFVVFRLSNWKDLGKAFLSVKPISFLFIVILTCIFLLFRAIAWRILLEKKVSIKQTFLTINIGYLLNNLFPLRAGEIGRALFLGQSSGLGMMRVLPTVVIERAFDLAFAAISLLITLPMALAMEWVRPVANTTLILVILGIGGLYLIARFDDKVHAWIIKVGKNWSLIDRYIIPQINSLLKGLSVLKNPKSFIASIFWIGCSWIIAYVVYFVVLVGMVPSAKFWWGIFTDAVLSMGIAIPSAPAALGVFEASLVGALAILGISNTSALAYAIIMHFMQFVTTGLIGFYALAREGKSIGKLFGEATSLKQPEYMEKSQDEP